jgi:hypothetical protein
MAGRWLQADEAEFSSWQRQMAVDRSRGHFFKSLYPTEDPSHVEGDSHARQSPVCHAETPIIVLFMLSSTAHFETWSGHINPIQKCGQHHRLWRAVGMMRLVSACKQSWLLRSIVCHSPGLIFGLPLLLVSVLSQAEASFLPLGHITIVQQWMFRRCQRAGRHRRLLDLRAS